MFKTYLRGFYPMFAPDAPSGTGTNDAGSESATDTVFDAGGQGLEEVSEALLMGGDEESSDTAADEAAAKVTADEAAAKVTANEAAAKVAADEAAAKLPTDLKDKADDLESISKDDPDSSDSKKSHAPPKGYVPLAAVKEAREENRYLKDQISQMNNRFDTLAKPGDKPEAKTDPDFEVLSKADYATLAEDDPGAALIYQHDLISHNESIRAQADDARNAEYAAEETQNIIDTATEAMEKVAPGIFEDGSEVQAELMTFAEELGFSDDMYYLTNPSTQIILPGQTETLLLGDQAASILSVLVSAKNKISSASKVTAETDATKATEVAELTASIRKEVETELLAKFKKETGTEFKSLTSIPKSKDGREFSKTDNLTEAQLAKLPADEYERYLSGS